MWSRGGVWFEWRGGEWEGRATSLVPRLLMPSRLRLSVINLIEALFLVDCGSKRKKQGAAAKKRNETEGSLAAVPLGSASECVRKARPTHARQVPSRVLKPYPLTLLVGADDRLSGSAARNSWPSPGAWCLVALSLYLCAWVYIRRGCVGGKRKLCPPLPSSLGLPFREIMAQRLGPGRSPAANPARRGPGGRAEGETHRNNVLCFLGNQTRFSSGPRPRRMVRDANAHPTICMLHWPSIPRGPIERRSIYIRLESRGRAAKV